MIEEDKNVDRLLEKISRLEEENRLLKEVLTDAGIDYETVISDEQSDPSGQYDPDQGARIHPFDVTDKVANQFFLLFCRGRKDVYELRHTNPKTGRTGYYTQCFNRWDQQCHKQKKDNVRCKDCEIQSYKPLNYHLIRAHMEGKDPYGNDVIAVYPMLEGSMCQLLVFDFDNHAAGAAQTDYANTDDEWKNEVNALREICRILGIDCAVERSRSGNGAHLWIFFKERVPAKLARRFGFALLDKGAESVNLKSFKYYDRMIPTNDVLPKGGLGNVIALSLQGLALKNGNSAFVDEVWNAYPDQLKFLSSIKRLSQAELEETGQTRTRKELIGNLQGAHDTLTGIIDVAMIRSLKKKGEFHPMLKEYGQVIMDECHHAASDSAIEVLQAVQAKYVHGGNSNAKERRREGEDKRISSRTDQVSFYGERQSRGAKHR
jgi:hypothetical protein